MLGFSTLAETPLAALPSARFSLVVAVGSFTLAGQDASLRRTGRLAPVAGGFTLSGQSASLLMGRRFRPLNGAFVLQGQSVVLRSGRRIASDVGNFVFTGQSAGLYRGYLVPAARGQFLLSGQPVSFIHVPPPMFRGRSRVRVEVSHFVVFPPQFNRQVKPRVSLVIYPRKDGI